MKKSIYIMLLLCVSFILSSCNLLNLPDKPTKGLKYTLIDEGTALSVSQGTMGDVDKLIIPTTYENIPVKEIADKAFLNCSSIKSVIIPDTITNIGYESFRDCTSLTEVIIPNSVVKISNSAFFGCSSLQSITLPFVGETENENNYFGYIFGAKTPYDNPSYVPNTLTSITVTEGTKTIGRNAFMNLNNLEYLSIPSSVTQIQSGILVGCTKLISLTTPMIGDSSYQAINSYFNENIYDINVSSIPETLTTININTNIINIPPYAFFGCKGLTNFNIPENVSYIGFNAFLDCISLTKIIIPKNVTYIDSNAFKNCSNLSIYCELLQKPVSWNDNWNIDDLPVTWGYQEN